MSRKYEIVLRVSPFGTTRETVIIEKDNMHDATLYMLNKYPRKNIIGIRTVSKQSGKRGKLQRY